MGLLALRDHGARVCLLALPLAVAGLGVAAFHVLLGSTVWPRDATGWYLACPAGIAGIGTAPQQSLAAFVLVTLVLFVGSVSEVRTTGRGRISLVAGLLLGAAGAAGSLLANPPMPDPKPLPDRPLEICQPTLRVVAGA